jgi:hypothetical protein
MSYGESLEAGRNALNPPAPVIRNTGVEAWTKTCFSKKPVDWKRAGMVALWVLALVVPGGFVAMTLYLSVRAARSRGLLAVPEVVRQSFVPPAAT